MMYKTYAERLKDSRWQKKRLEILSRDSFACTNCLDDTKTLHVHHLAYIKANQPWEYENEMLLTLCEDCHTMIECRQKDQAEELLFLFKTKLKDGFIRNCAIDIFKKADDLHDFIYTLWEAMHLKEDRDELMEFLEGMFTRRNNI